MKFDAIPRVVVKLMLPFMLLFALYVQFHGEVGPGGGFQAGVITAGMVILYALMFGIHRAKQIVSQKFVERMVPFGVLVYVGTGVVAMLFGGNYLDYSYLAHDSRHGQEYGIMAIELGVLITVSSSMVAIFYAFVERGR